MAIHVDYVGTNRTYVWMYTHVYIIAMDVYYNLCVCKDLIINTL